MRSLVGYLPTPAFVMGKKTIKNLKAGTSAEVSAFFMFVMETPAESQNQSEALLNKMIEAMGAKQKDIVISHQVQDRAALESQIQSVKPKILIALGEVAAQALGFDGMRGKLHRFLGTKLITTFHPSYMLTNPSTKKECWEDLQMAMKEIGWKK